MKSFLAFVMWISTASIALGGVKTATTSDADVTITATVTAEAPAELPALPPDQIVEVKVKPGFIEQLLDGTFLAQLFAFVALFLGFMRSLSNLLIWISEKTENKSDDKWAKYISDATWYIGVLVGKAGWGVNKSVIADKVSTAAAALPSAK